MNPTTPDPNSDIFHITYQTLPDDLSEGPWTTLVMSLLACVGVLLLAAGVYSGSI